MKTLLFLLLMAPTAFIHAQDVSLPKDSAGKVTYTDVVRMDSASRTELYDRAKYWFINNFNTADNSMLMDSKESGMLVGKGRFAVSYTNMPASAGYIDFTLSIFLKDGRYKYLVTHIFYNTDHTDFSGGNLDTDERPWNEGFKCSMVVWNQIKANTDAQFRKLIRSLGQAMQRPLPSEEANW